jgi:mannose-6-phosphate isomerase
MGDHKNGQSWIVCNKDDPVH